MRFPHRIRRGGAVAVGLTFRETSAPEALFFRSARDIRAVRLPTGIVDAALRFRTVPIGLAFGETAPAETLFVHRAGDRVAARGRVGDGGVGGVRGRVGRIGADVASISARSVGRIHPGVVPDRDTATLHACLPRTADPSPSSVAPSQSLSAPSHVSALGLVPPTQVPNDPPVHVSVPAAQTPDPSGPAGPIVTGFGLTSGAVAVAVRAVGRHVAVVVDAVPAVLRRPRIHRGVGIVARGEPVAVRVGIRNSAPTDAG